LDKGMAKKMMENKTDYEDEDKQLDSSTIHHAQELILYMADIEKKRWDLTDKLGQIVEGRFSGSETKEQLEKEELDFSHIQDQIKIAIEESGVPKHIKAMVQDDNLKKFIEAEHPASSDGESDEGATGRSVETAKPKAEATSEPTLTPTVKPTVDPSVQPTLDPTDRPTKRQQESKGVEEKGVEEKGVEKGMDAVMVEAAMKPPKPNLSKQRSDNVDVQSLVEAVQPAPAGLLQSTSLRSWGMLAAGVVVLGVYLRQRKRAPPRMGYSDISSGQSKSA